jgi:hypothetical protein
MLLSAGRCFPSGHADPAVRCLLPGVDRTWRSKLPLPPIDHSQKFSNADGGAGVRKLLARNKFHRREHKTFDALNVLCV